VYRLPSPYAPTRIDPFRATVILGCPVLALAYRKICPSTKILLVLLDGVMVADSGVAINVAAVVET
jgi:hypothetical protein